MRKLYFILSVSLFLYLVLLMSPSKVSAVILFQDDFSEYSNNSFPSSNWETYLQPGTTTCSAPWVINNGELGITINQSSCTTHILPKNGALQNDLSEYILEFDVRFVSGTDRHVDYRLNPNTGFIHVIHFAIPGDFSVDSDNQNFTVNVANQYTFNTKYHFKLIVTSTRLQIYENDAINQQPQLIRDISHTAPIPLGTVGFGSNPGSGAGTTETWFDNVVVSSIEHNLNVPLLKQTALPWANQLYDSADLWAPAGKRNISNWGCAITSAAMVFQYFGITKMPDGSALDPKSLNSWLKSRPLGYFSGGITNWAELAVLSKLAKSKNPAFSYDTLEYDFTLGENKSILTSGLQNNIPGILQEPGHFIVAKGFDSLGRFLINDPYYNYADLSFYSNTFSKLIRFVPSNSDLSYIILASQGNITVNLKDKSDNSVGDTFLQEPLVDDLGGQVTSGNSIRFTQLAKPTNDNYSFEVSALRKTTYTIDILLYDKNGNSKKITFSGITGPNEPDFYKVKFNKETLSSSKVNKIITFESLINDIRSLCNTGEIKSSHCKSFVNQVNNAQRSTLTQRTRTAGISMLKNLDTEIRFLKVKEVSQIAYDILHSELQELIASFNY